MSNGYLLHVKSAFWAQSTHILNDLVLEDLNKTPRCAAIVETVNNIQPLSRGINLQQNPMLGFNIDNWIRKTTGWISSHRLSSLHIEVLCSFPTETALSCSVKLNDNGGVTQPPNFLYSILSSIMSSVNALIAKLLTNVSQSKELKAVLSPQAILSGKGLGTRFTVKFPLFLAYICAAISFCLNS
jgi:hypothetical protein